MKIFTSIFLFSCIVSFYSCTKEQRSNCEPPSNIEITTNSPVIEGWPLTISTTSSAGSLFRWTGPAWEVNYAAYASDAHQQGIIATKLADAGTYKVQLRDFDGCVAYEGSTEVKIIPAPLPPCNVTKNSSTSNVIGVGGVPFTGVIYFQGGGGIFTVQTTGGGQSITFNFNGDNVPKPGIYKTSGYFALDEATCGCYITSFPYDFINTSGQDVYVNKVNGKTQVSFCSATFTNPLGSTAIKISANVTEP
jgi:hypothetical protein